MVLGSCRATKNLEEDQYLVRKNKITFLEGNPGINVSDVNTLLRPRPNKHFLGFIPLKTSFYNMGMRGKPDKKFRKWLREKAGERPVAYDSIRVQRTAREVEQYLAKVGYFHSKVTSTVLFKENRKAIITYQLNTTEPYRIRNFKYHTTDSILSGYMAKALENSKIREGKIFNMFTLEEERERVSEYLRNQGYYNFNQNYIYYKVDSSLDRKQMDLVMHIKDNEVYSDEDSENIIEIQHKRHFIRNIYINASFDPMQSRPSLYDTLIVDLRNIKKGRSQGIYHIIYKDKPEIKPNVLTQSVFLNAGDHFNETDIKKTRLRLNELGVFNYTNISFKESGYRAEDTLKEEPLLDCTIDLMKRKLHAFTVETEGTNKAGRLGIGVIFSYENRNFFRGSEIFNFKLRGAMEFQTALSASNETEPTNRLISTFEYGGEVSITFPKFLIPLRQERFPKYFRPKTLLRLGLSYENRPQYKRTITNLSFGYDWRQSETKTHQFFPFDINFVDILPTPEFQEELEQEPNDRIRNQYTDHMIMAMIYSFVLNTQKLTKYQNFLYYRTNVEPAGNLLQLLNVMFGTKSDSADYYTVLGVRYSQYFRNDHDMRYYHFLNRKGSLAFRFYLGIGIPYGNADDLPLEKGFYGGGANGIRAWPYRLLGPGAYYNPDDFFDRMGDLHLETNIEYRFPIYRFIKGAVFADIGNVWLLKENSSYPGGEFNFDTFHKELAIGAGLGARFDFDFFIFRLDFAAKTRDPSRPDGERWVFNGFQFKDVIVNFAIGYPF